MAGQPERTPVDEVLIQASLRIDGQALAATVVHLNLNVDGVTRNGACRTANLLGLNVV